MAGIVRNSVGYTGYMNDNPTVVALAQKAVCDSEGNNIEETYVKKNGAAALTENMYYHNSFFRGLDITAAFKDGSMYEEIQSGKFTNIYVGDYFTATINGTNHTCRIAKLLTYHTYLNTYGGGDSMGTRVESCAVIVPDIHLASTKWNSSNSCTSGYKSSAIASYLSSTVDTWLTSTFGSHVLTIATFASSAMNSSLNSGAGGTAMGVTTSEALKSVKSELMSEKEVFGSRLSSCGVFGSRVGECQLPLFALCPQLIALTNGNYWLRDIFSTTQAVAVQNYGTTYYGNMSMCHGGKDASSSFGVRPKWYIR